MKLRISRQARSDIAEILRFTQDRFGDGARQRYQQLLQAGLSAISEDPERAGSIAREEIAAGLRSLHLIYCRRQARVLKPRHILFYRTTHDQIIEVARVLHEAMELASHMRHDDLH
ncbi:type II toxin-antitoxin system RelE/ParE family toxin [Pseudomonas putida]|uniref:Plasmid stabilization protein ParE n=1 Tax=Pseudomonas putida TaxID=303 RepID=A0A177SUV2_PSEPU|nr:type II toxin-antitoxin system RelE/ParE family toxin [Pseudomonas putida]OAI94723.1 plasmid stabilization protein ParE [Pseudomonas putida]